MSKLDREGILKLCREMNKKEEGSIYSLGSEKANLRMPRWSTGIEDLDNIIGGGMPEGRIVEIYGAESAGKTSLAYQLCAQCEMALNIPIEGCVDCDTEFFNGFCWKKISDYSEGEKVLQYNSDGTAELVKPLKYHKYKAKKLWHVFSNRLDMVVSEYHNVVYKTKAGNLKIKPFHDIRIALDWNCDGFNADVPKTFSYSGEGIRLNDDTIRLMVAVFADGSFKSDSTLCYIGLSKRRKKERLEMLLKCCGIEYRVKNKFYIFNAPFCGKHYPMSWYRMNKHQLSIVVDEMKYWDGCQYEVGHMPSFCTVNKKDADFIQFVYTSLGYAAYITTRDRRSTPKYIEGRKLNNERISYNVCSGIVSNKVSLRKVKYEEYYTKDGAMYCFTMPSSMWVMRRKNKIIVTGNTFDPSRAKAFGNRPKQMLVYRASWGEDAMNKAIKFAQKGIPMIVIDSVPFCTPYEDVEKIMKAVNKDAEIEQRVGGVARLMTKYIPVLNNVAELTGTTVIMINQIRDTVGAMPFAEQTHTPGGHLLKHSYSLRLMVARKDWIKIPNYNPSVADKEEKIGLIMKVKVVKSKISNPQGTCEIPMFFDRGFVSFDDIAEIRQEIMKERKEKYK